MKKDIFVPIFLVVLLVLLLEPFGFMPSAAVMTILAFIVAAFVLFAILLWREHGLDEREEAHINRADRIGFISGALVLLAAIVAESLGRMLSPWLVVALIAMVAAKAFTLIYERRAH
ncbi:MAG: hypothetical protein KGH68_00590 [Patescibacteria group bacterium]|nr:hypothetical protein [Patescibacteria group bacterium]